ncbi:methyl-accepting chemotaxis protein [Vibrio sp. E150_011]
MNTQFLRHTSIQNRLYLLILVVSVALLIPLVLSLVDYDKSLTEAKQTKTRHLVESAHTLINHYYEQQQSGQLSQSEAQLSAIAAIKTLRYDHGDYFWINDMTPTMVMHPLKPALVGQNLSQVADPNGKRLFMDIVQVAKSQQEGLVNYMWPKPGADAPVEKISYIKTFSPWGWIVGTGVYVDDIQAQVWGEVKRVMISVGVAVLFMLAFATWLSRSIVTPCQETLNALNDIASGDGDLTRQLPEKGSDELSQIAAAFNRFTTKLGLIINDIKPVTENITEAAVSLNKVAQGSASKSQQQQQAVDTVASAMNELHASNQEVANSAQHAANAAKQASEQGRHGTEVIELASSYMQSLSIRLTETDSNIQMLANDTQEVGSVLEVIRGVAEQTNLLALNAAIEAARAGEQGRGFAVVADEVRTLATRTQSSTDEIEQIIQKLQSQASEVSQSMAQTQQQSQATLEQAANAKNALTEIDDQVNSILSLNQQIAEASSQQTLATDEISQNLTQIADHGSQSALEATALAEASERLLEDGQTLTNGVGAFKVS